MQAHQTETKAISTPIEIKKSPCATALEKIEKFIKNLKAADKASYIKFTETFFLHMKNQNADKNNMLAYVKTRMKLNQAIKELGQPVQKEYKDACEELVNAFYPDKIYLLELHLADKNKDSKEQKTLEDKSQGLPTYEKELDNFRELYPVLKTSQTQSLIKLGELFNQLKSSHIHAILVGNTQVKDAQPQDLATIENIYFAIKNSNILQSLHNYICTAPDIQLMNYFRVLKRITLSIVLSLFIIIKKNPTFISNNTPDSVKELEKYNLRLIEELKNTLHQFGQEIFEYNDILKHYSHFISSSKTQSLKEAHFDAEHACNLVNLSKHYHTQRNSQKRDESIAELYKFIGYTKGTAASLLQYTLVWEVNYHLFIYPNIAKLALKHEPALALTNFVCQTNKSILHSLLNEIKSLAWEFENFLTKLLIEYERHRQSEDEKNLEKAANALLLFSRLTVFLPSLSPEALNVHPEFAEKLIKIFPQAQDSLDHLYDMTCSLYREINQKLEKIYKKKNITIPDDFDYNAHENEINNLLAEFDAENEKKLKDIQQKNSKQTKAAAKKRKKQNQTAKEKEKDNETTLENKTEQEPPTSQHYKNAHQELIKKNYPAAIKLYDIAVQEAKKADDHFSLVAAIAEIAHTLLIKANDIVKTIENGIYEKNPNCIANFAKAEHDYREAIRFAEMGLEHCVTHPEKKLDEKTLNHIQKKLTKPLKMILEDSEKKLVEFQKVVKDRKEATKERILQIEHIRHQARANHGAKLQVKKNSPEAKAGAEEKQTHNQPKKGAIKKYSEQDSLANLWHLNEELHELESSIESSTALFTSPVADYLLLHPPKKEQLKLEFKPETTSTALIPENLSYQERLVLLASKRKSKTDSSSEKLFAGKSTFFQAGSDEAEKALILHPVETKRSGKMA